ncbi:hypothetical protein Mapa_015960 [Marchantia paleacea]|nr:hypothetical protein Mapa_015960 [Marchantia paleacea]
MTPHSGHIELLPFPKLIHRHRCPLRIPCKVERMSTANRERRITEHENTLSNRRVLFLRSPKAALP